MYSVGSIEPDGMLNGATMKHRKAQASTITIATKRARLQMLSFSGCFGAVAAFAERRRMRVERIGLLVSARCAQVNPGWLLRRP